MIKSWEELERAFLNRFYNTHRIVSIVELTSSWQGKEKLIINYICRRRNLSMKKIS